MTTATDGRPDWLKNYAPDETPPPQRWKPGQSGNPKGRPPGIPDKRSRIAQEFEKEGSAVARVVIDAAKEGDMQAANLVLTRIAPPLKARAEKVQFQLDPAKPLTEQAQQVMQAIAAGEVDPETGRMLIDCLNSFAGLKQTDELAARLNQLETQLNGGQACS